jgi:glycosyltransferase involved in cell wall biosynthesis
MKVLISTLGRSHFVNSASSIIAAGVDAVLFQGWVVQNPKRSLLVKCATWLLGRRSFQYGMEKRVTPELQGRNKGDFLAEAFSTLLIMTLGRLGDSLQSWCIKVGFIFHGFRTRFLISKYDIFHVRSGLGQGGAIQKAKKKKTKVLVDQSFVHPYFFSEDLRGGRLKGCSFWTLVLQDCVEADLLLVNSDYVKETFVRYGYPVEKIRVIHLGVRKDFNQLRMWSETDKKAIWSLDNPLSILFTGTFNERKGASYFLEAIAALLAKNRPIKITVVGTVDLTDAQRERFKEILSKIDFTGHVSQDQLKIYLSSHHIYLFPSLAEGCAQSGMEAMSAGLCVLATRESGLPIRIKETGFYVPARNSSYIVNVIESLLERPEEIIRVGRNASQQLKEYTWQHYAENVKLIYSELMQS